MSQESNEEFEQWFDPSLAYKYSFKDVCWITWQAAREQKLLPEIVTSNTIASMIDRVHNGS